MAWLIDRDIACPIVRLTDTAQQIQAGDLAAQAEVTTENEIGIFGNTFQAMTSKLRETLESLLDYLEQVKVVMAAAAAGSWRAQFMKNQLYYVNIFTAEGYNSKWVA